MAKKRGQNEGSIYKRNDGRWEAKINLGWVDGRRARKSFYGETRAQAQEQLTHALRDRLNGLPIISDQQTVGQYLSQWLENSAKPTIRELTYQQYSQHLRLYLIPCLGKFKLSKLTPQYIQNFINEKLKIGLSPRTVELSIIILRRALTQALRWGLVAQNVATLVDAPRSKRPEVQPLDQDQARRFLTAVKGERLEALFKVSLTLGLRRGEVLALRWTDLNLEDNSLSVSRSVQRIGGRHFDGASSRLQFVEPKSARSRRTIPIPEVLLPALLGHREHQNQERIAAGSNWKDNNLVFSTTIGTPIEPRKIVSEFKRMIKRAELPLALRFHDLRHSAASLLLAQGVHARTVMEILGHSQISLTMDTYSHVVPSLTRDAMSKIGAALAESA